jgi:glycosyltransferase involved in cell wall biosynthesis
MRILLKCPTRSRPQKIMDTLTRYMKLANHPEQLGVVLSCDDSDMTMSRNLVHEEIDKILKKTAYHKIFTGPNTSKIEACNANMSEIDWEWDIVVLVSDDMIPQVQGYDDAIRNHMLARFPDTDGILWFNDGYQGEKLNTLTIFGRKMYDRFGYLYHPDYKSLFCDTELTDLCKGELKDKCLYVSYPIIRHEHPGTGFAQNMDELYDRNQKYWDEDMHTYIRRKKYPYDWSILIPTMPGREEGLQRLLKSIAEKVQRNAPELKYEVCLSFDNRETSIGTKRQKLLEQASGRYLSFIDDDDDITDEYIQDLWKCIQEGKHVMRLRGFMKGYTFIHSLDVKFDDYMATQDDPPIFQRPPNHLNPMLSDIAKFIPFKDAVYGEDLDWTVSLFKAGFLKTEYNPESDRTHYIYNLGDRTVPQVTIDAQRVTKYGDLVKPKPAQPVETKQSGLKLGPRGFVSK